MTARAAFFALALICPVAAKALAQTSDPALIGCWQSEKLVLFSADGTSTEPSPASPPCRQEITDSQFKLNCFSERTGRWVQLVLSYRIESPGKYVSKITRHSEVPGIVGVTEETEYRVDGDRLYLTTYPQKNSRSPAAKVIKVVSTLVRVNAGPDKCLQPTPEK